MCALNIQEGTKNSIILRWIIKFKEFQEEMGVHHEQRTNWLIFTL